MNWMLIVVPALGVCIALLAVQFARKLFPPVHVEEKTPPQVEAEVRKTATLLSTAVGTAIRSERDRTLDEWFEKGSSAAIEDELANEQKARAAN